MTPQEQIILQQTKAHQEWLKGPVTKDFIKILTERQAKFTSDLQAGILVASDSVKETAYRNSISTLNAVLVIATDSKQFVSRQNKQTTQ